LRAAIAAATIAVFLGACSSGTGPTGAAGQVGPLQAKRSWGELTGKPRLGTRLGSDGKTLEAHAAERQAIQRAQELRGAGLSLRAISVQLAAESILSRGGEALLPAERCPDAPRLTAARAV